MKKVLKSNIILYILFASLTTLVNVSIYLLSYKFLIKSILVCNILAYSISISLSFISNKLIVFKSRNGKLKKEIFGFLLVKLLSFMIDSIVLHLCFNIIGLSNIVSKIISNCSTTINNYTLNKKLVFKSQDKLSK